MKITIHEDNLEFIRSAAKRQGMNVEEFINASVGWIIENGSAAASIERLEEFITSQMNVSISEIAVNSFALRNQVASLHADISNSSERAIEASEKATDVGVSTVYGDDAVNDEND